MKKSILTLVVGLLCFASSTVLSAAPLTPAGPNEAFVLLQDLGLYKDKFGGALEWLESLTLGDKLTLLGSTGKFKQDGRERDYVKVKSLSGKEGWVRANLVASNASLAIVKSQKTYLYTEPRDIKVTSATVSYMTLVAVLKDGSNDSFAKIAAYDSVQDRIIDNYVSRDDLTSADADVNAVILYTVAMGLKSPEVRKNLLNLAVNKYGSTLFIDKIQAALNPGAAPAKASKAADGIYLVNDDNVNVRETPDEKSGTVVKSVNKGTKVEVLEVTTSSYTVAGMTAPWYKIKEPAGWVFGSFLTPAP